MENAVKIFQWIKNSIASRCRELNFAMGLSGPFTMKFLYALDSFNDIFFIIIIKDSFLDQRGKAILPADSTGSRLHVYRGEHDKKQSTPSNN